MSRINKKGDICCECDKQWILGHQCASKSNKDKASRMANEHRGVYQLIKK